MGAAGGYLAGAVFSPAAHSTSAARHIVVGDGINGPKDMSR